MNYRERALLERELNDLRTRNYRKKSFMDVLIEGFKTSNIVHFCTKDDRATANGLYGVPVYELMNFAKEEGFTVRSVRAESLDVLL